MMQVSAGLLLLHIALYRVILARPDVVPQERDDDSPGGGSIAGGFALVFRSRYLLLIAGMIVLLNLVNSTGEYLLSTFAESRLDSELAAAIESTPNLDIDAFSSRFFGVFYGDFFFWVNIVSVILQAFVVSRVVKYLGIAGLLFALPIVALGNYGWIAMGFGFGAFRILKTLENATDYSVMNTGKATVWLPTSREEKYQAKQAIDTFFVRIGDVFAAGLVYLGTQQLAFGTVDFARVNLGMILAWMVITFLTVLRYRRKDASP